ncbi:MAG TPA: Fe(2+) transporter permease subunit FeoB [Pseudomonadales bacterium]|nr:Fe(2+) transporter permease subunit FeoB [Pseudomonadales bacterium]
MRQYTIAVVGNPNCGKTTLFNALTGARQRTGNWPGVTVDRKEGQFEIDGQPIRLIDLPGVYSLDRFSQALDEKVACDYLLAGEADLLINILDAANLERSLYLTAQLIEMGAPLLVVLNMMDHATAQGLTVDPLQLSQQLGCPVVVTVASREQGIAQLKTAIAERLTHPPTRGDGILHPVQIEFAVATLVDRLDPLGRDPARRWLALELLANEGVAPAVEPELLHDVAEMRRQISTELHEDVELLIADSRYGFARRVAQEVATRGQAPGSTSSDRIDRIVLNRFAGVPIFLGVIYLMFLFSINFSGALIDFFDQVTGALLVDGLGQLLLALGLPQWVKVLLADGLGGGVQVVATFIPVIGALYLFLSFLEDSGFMARAAFVMDRLMNRIGLPGKAFVPLIIGFGCNVPAIMATRTLESHRERILTSMMAPFMSCGARLSVYALFAAAFFPVGGANVVFSLYLLGILIAVLTALLLKNSLLKGEADAYLLELPAYHLPTLKGICIHTWDKLKGFVVRAGRIIIVMVLVINLLNSIGRDGSFGNENSENSLLSWIAREGTPLFAPMGLREENWPAVVGILAGVLAKEVVVGTLDSIYSRMDRESAGEADAATPFDLLAQLSAAAATIPQNLLQLLDRLSDPLGFSVIKEGDPSAAAAEQQVSLSTFGAMVSRFDGQAGAYAYLLFILLYFPCVSTIAALRREAGTGWTLFAAGWGTFIAYTSATFCYQLASFARHPGSSSFWIALVLLSWVAVVGVFRWLGRSAPSTASVKAGAA